MVHEEEAWNRVSHYEEDILQSKKVDMDHLARHYTDPDMSLSGIGK